MIQEALEAQAQWIESLQFENLNKNVIASAKRVLLDSLAAMAAGSALLKSPKSLGEGLSCVVGKEGTASGEWAAFLNGTAMVSTELDEGNQYAKGHPASHFLPALLSAIRGGTCSGKEFITVMVAAYETAVLWGSAVTLTSKVHPHGNWVTASAAAAVSKLQGRSREFIHKALILANSIPMPTAWASVFAGANVRDAYVGLSNLHGLMVPAMVETGIFSEPEVVLSLFSEILGTALDGKKLGETERELLYIEKNYMKLYPCCRYTHGVLDGLQELMAQGLKACEVERIEVEAYKAAAMLKETRPDQILSARFSIPFTAAAMLLRGKVTAEEMTLPVIRDTEIRDLAGKISVREDGGLNSWLPDTRAMRIKVIRKEKAPMELMITEIKGDFSLPLSDEELKEKFHGMTSFLWDESRREKIIDLVERLETIEDMNELLPLLGA